MITWKYYTEMPIIANDIGYFILISGAFRFRPSISGGPSSCVFFIIHFLNKRTAMPMVLLVKFFIVNIKGIPSEPGLDFPRLSHRTAPLWIILPPYRIKSCLQHSKAYLSNILKTIFPSSFNYVGLLADALPGYQYQLQQ